HADGGDTPQSGGGGQAANGGAVLDDRASAEEADAGHDPVGDSRRVDVDVELTCRVRPRTLGEADRDDHDQCASDGDQDVGAEAGLAPAHLPLDADQTADN